MPTQTPARCPNCGRANARTARFCQQCGAALSADEPSRVDTPPIDPFHGVVLAGGYRVEKLIARGGMGEVYLARHIELKQTAAVKFLHRRFAADDELAARFANEANTLMRVRHPLAVHVHNSGRLPDGTLYIVMEWVDGISLAQLLEKRGTLDVATAVRLGLLAAEVLSVAHRQSVIHRDVKPDNIMVVEGPQGRPSIKMLDFGIAKILGDDTVARTQTGTVYGTPEYMSPEQAEGKTVDHRGDIYQLGLVLYAMVVGHPPFEAQNKLSILQRHIKEKHVEVARAAKQRLPDEFASLIDRMLAKDPRDRPQSFDEVLDTLEKLAPGVGPSRTPLRTLDSAVAPSAVAEAPAQPAPAAAPRREPAPATTEQPARATTTASVRLVDEPRILRKRRDSSAPTDLAQDFSLGSTRIPVQSELKFEMPAAAADGDDAWSLSGANRDAFARPFDETDGVYEQPVPERRVGFFSALFGVLVIIGVVAAVSVYRARMHERAASADDGEYVALDGSASGSGEGSAHAATAEASGAEAAAAAPERDAPPAAVPSSPVAPVAPAAPTSTTAPAVAAPSAPSAPSTPVAPSAPAPSETLSLSAREAIADLREARIDEARRAATELATADGAADNPVVTQLVADLEAFDALEQNIAELLAANQCVRADEKVVEMRTRFSTRLASRHYAALDTCRASQRQGSSGSSTSSSSGANGGTTSGNSGTGSSRTDGDRRVTPPSEL